MGSDAAASWDELLTEAHAWALKGADFPPDRDDLGGLTGEERKYAGKITRDAVRAEYVATRRLCRAVLSRYAKIDPLVWRFEKGKSGKPGIAGPRGFASLKFNLTHTKGLVICVVSRAGEVGVDAEETSRAVDVEEVAEHFFSAAERAALMRLRGAKRKGRFFDQWVVKEAYLKGLGAGLAREPEGFTIEIGADYQVGKIGNWRLSLHRPTRRHVAAVAVRAKHVVEIRWFDAGELFEAGVAVV